MKNLLLLAMAITLLTSCASADKLLERGDYDALITLATKKMSGKKKKDVYVTALEEGFEKVTRRDMTRIESLRRTNRPEDWESIMRIARDIQRRQDRIEPFLPLVSEGGYQAKFTFVRTDQIMEEARSSAVTLYERRLDDMIAAARRGDKPSARQAVSLLDHIRSISSYYYRPGLRDELVDLGLNKIYVRIENHSAAHMPPAYEEELLSADFANSGHKWNRFYTDIDEGMQMDYRVVLRILDIATTRDEWGEKQTPYTKEIVDGWEYVLDDRGNVKKDSLGNDIKRDKKVKVNATVVETIQTKRAMIHGRVDITNLHTGSRIFSQPMEVEIVFEHVSRTFYGDERALDKNLRQRIPPVSFPSDAELVWDAFRVMKPRFFNEVRRVNYSS